MFNNKLFYLDDTNIPFDWDHIYPHNLVSGKKNIPRIIADFYNSIGNFRAWPYELNRMDSDNLPIKKFAPLKYSENTEDLTKSWQCFIEKRPNLIADVNELTIKLLNWSICSNDWANKEVADVKRDGIIIYNLIIKRAIEIIKIWNKRIGN